MVVVANKCDLEYERQVGPRGESGKGTLGFKMERGEETGTRRALEVGDCGGHEDAVVSSSMSRV